MTGNSTPPKGFILRRMASTEVQTGRAFSGKRSPQYLTRFLLHGVTATGSSQTELGLGIVIELADENASHISMISPHLP